MVVSVDARTGEVIRDVSEATDEAQLEEICRRAEIAVGELERLGRKGRATMLEAAADALERRRDEVVETADRESALGRPRLEGELARTCFQLRFLADVVAEGGYLEVAVDHAASTPAGPRPDLRRMLRPLGPVAVFGASNFPLAFSVPGGDTASALAAGCPVVAKVHDAHPQTALISAEVLAEGARAVGVAPAVFLVFGEAAGVALVRHRAVRAVGFTGSLAGGRALFDVAASRPEPIPFYGELGALNAVVVAPKAAARRATEISSGLVASFTLGVGQFCTKPGLCLVPAGDAGDGLVSDLVAAVKGLEGAPMLTERIARSFASGAADLLRHDGVRLLAEARPGDGVGFEGVPSLLEADASQLSGPLLSECFGPVLVVVRYRDGAELEALCRRLSPSLAATVHAEPEDDALVGPLVRALSDKAGRVVVNGYPTGLAVAYATHHGGPYPATTDPLHTSVGAASLRRWLRPVCYQEVPERFLPPELSDAPPPDHLVPRRVDGRLVLSG